MAAGIAVDAPATSLSWVGTILNGPGDWRLRARIPWLLGLIMLFDSWDSLVIAFTLPSIAQEWKLGPLQGGWLISAGYGGQFVGAILCGWLAERYGRLPLLKPVVILMGLLAIACAFADRYTIMVAIRLVQGIAIGGATPVAISYLNEIAPAATRGRFFGTFQFLMLAGFGAASATSAYIVPHFGWRAMYLLGATPLLLVPFLFVLPESPRWLAARGRTQAAIAALMRLGGRAAADMPDAAGGAGVDEDRPAFAILFTPAYRRRTSVAGLLWFLTSLVSFGLVTWVPSIYVSVFGMTLAQALGYNALSTISVFVLPLVLRFTIDRIGRRPPAILGTGLGGLSLLALAVVSATAAASSHALVVTLTIAGGVGVSIGSMILWPYSAEIYETRVRAVALGAASSLARGASMLTPLVVAGMLSATGSIVPVFLIFGASAVTVSLLWIFATRETAGRDVDA